MYVPNQEEQSPTVVNNLIPAPEYSRDAMQKQREKQDRRR